MTVSGVIGRTMKAAAASVRPTYRSPPAGICGGKRLAEPAGKDRARDIGQADQRDGDGAQRRGRGDAETVEHRSGLDRAADLGDEGREMRGDEAQLVAAGKEAHEDQRVGRIAEGLAEGLRQAFLQLGAAGGAGLRRSGRSRRLAR
jgi:hypothetical protein